MTSTASLFPELLDLIDFNAAPVIGKCSYRGRQVDTNVCTPSIEVNMDTSPSSAGSPNAMSSSPQQQPEPMVEDESSVNQPPLRPLHGYQTSAVAKLIAIHKAGYSGALLVSPTGTGKTAISVSFVANVVVDTSNALYITKSRLVSQVYRELSLMYGPGHGVTVLPTSALGHISPGKDCKLLVLDEYSTTSRNISLVRNINADFTLLVSAKPGPSSSRFQALVDLCGYQGTDPSPVTVKVRDTDVPDHIWSRLPVLEIRIKLTKSQRAVYDSLRSTYTSKLTGTDRLKTLKHILVYLSSCKIPRVIKLICDSVASDPNVKIVVLCIHTNTLTAIRLALPTQMTRVVTTCVFEFGQPRARKNVLVGTVGKLGTGIDIPHADGMILVDVPWCRRVHGQAIGRIRRVGGKKVQRVGQIIADNTIDSKLYEMHHVPTFEELVGAMNGVNLAQ